MKFTLPVVLDTQTRTQTNTFYTKCPRYARNINTHTHIHTETNDFIHISRRTNLPEISLGLLGT